MIQISEYLPYLWITHQSALKHHLPIDQAIGKGLVLAQKRMCLTTFQWNIKKRDYSISRFSMFAGSKLLQSEKIDYFSTMTDVN